MRLKTCELQYEKIGGAPFGTCSHEYSMWIYSLKEYLVKNNLKLEELKTNPHLRKGLLIFCCFFFLM